MFVESPSYHLLGHSIVCVMFVFVWAMGGGREYISLTRRAYLIFHLINREKIGKVPTLPIRW